MFLSFDPFPSFITSHAIPTLSAPELFSCTLKLNPAYSIGNLPLPTFIFTTNLFRSSPPPLLSIFTNPFFPLVPGSRLCLLLGLSSSTCNFLFLSFVNLANNSGRSANLTTLLLFCFGGLGVADAGVGALMVGTGLALGRGEGAALGRGDGAADGRGDGAAEGLLDDADAGPSLVLILSFVVDVGSGIGE
jgi:hypothetical protein